MTQILIAAGVLLGIGLLCGILLVLSDRFFHVEEDETFTKIRACLPGANCGACGYSGCDGYAKVLAHDDSVATNLCIPGADAVAGQIAALLGKEAMDVEEMMAVAACDGTCNVTDTAYDYSGPASCAAVRLLYGSNGLCRYGCIGMGDCAAACPSDAICIRDGIARIDARHCTGCGLCTRTCPQQILHLVPKTAAVAVMCSNKDKGAQTRKACSHGCIGCKKCEKTCPAGAVTVSDNLARIDDEKCVGCGKCAEVCPTGAIVKIGCGRKE